MSSKNGCDSCADEANIEARPMQQAMSLNPMVQDLGYNTVPYSAPALETCITPIGGEAMSCPEPQYQKVCTPGYAAHSACHSNYCCHATAKVAQPYYQNVNMCPENNKQTIYVVQKSGAFKTKQSFAMPACSAKLRVVFDSAIDVPIGAWLWAQGYGRLTITGFNPVTNEIELRNDCPSSTCDALAQAAPGTTIPSCTVFTLMGPTCSEGSAGGIPSLYPYLNSGFTAPASGTCIDINVTTVNGLSVNKNVNISTGTYRVSAIKSATLITICNDGSGVTPGVPVEYKDGAGTLITPIVLIDSNACLNVAGVSGKLLVCDNNTMKPLAGTQSGQIPVLDFSTGLVNFRTLGIPTLDCTPLTVCLTLDPALPLSTSYLAQVQSTADFMVGQLLTIGGTSFEVDTIDSATQLHITPIEAPSAIQTYPVGATLCSATCCDQLQSDLSDLIIKVDNLDNNASNICDGPINFAAANFNDSVANSIVGLSPSTAFNGNAAVLNFSNDSCVYTMGYRWGVYTTYQHTIFGDPGDSIELLYEMLIGEGNVALPPLVLARSLRKTHAFIAPPGGIAGAMRESFTDSYEFYSAIPPLTVLRGISAQPRVTWIGNVNSVDINFMQVRIVLLGAAFA